MGVGKTTVGRLLARELELPFFDSDEVIETRTGDTGARIAARDGVDRLHELELEVFLDLCAREERAVLAPASSVVDHPRGRRAMAENLTVWLTAPDHVVAVRQGSGGHRRPIDAEERERLRARRAPHLEMLSDIEVDTGSVSPQRVVSILVERISGDQTSPGIQKTS